MPFADMPLTQTPLRSVSRSEQPDSKDQPSETTRFPHLGCRYRHLYHLTASIRFSLMDVPPRTLLNSSPPSLCAPVEEKWVGDTTDFTQPARRGRGVTMTSGACDSRQQHWFGVEAAVFLLPCHIHLPLVKFCGIYLSLIPFLTAR